MSRPEFPELPFGFPHAGGRSMPGVLSEARRLEAVEALARQAMAAAGGGSGVPDGGVLGDILTKASATDGDTEWLAPPTYFGEMTGANQTVGGTPQNLIFNVVVENDNITASTWHNRFQIITPGAYIVGVAIEFQANIATTGRAFFDLVVNGGLRQRLRWGKKDTNAREYGAAFPPEKLAAGDLITFRMAQAGDTGVNLQPRATITRAS